MSKLKPHLSYANVVATLALIVAVAGIPTAVAVTKAKKNTVTSKSIVNGAIKPADLAENAVTSAKIGAGQVTAGDLAATEVISKQNTPPMLGAQALCPTNGQLLGAGGAATGELIAIAPFTNPGSGGVSAGSTGLNGATAHAICLKETAGN